MTPPTKTSKPISIASPPINGPYLNELSGLRKRYSISESSMKECYICKDENHLALWEKWFRNLIWVGRIFQSFPISYHSCKGVLHVTESKLILLWWFIKLLILTIDNIYLLVISKNVELNSVGDKEFVDFWVHTISRIIACIITWAMASSLHGTVQTFNTIAENRRNWKYKYGAWSQDFVGPAEKSFRQTVQFTIVFITFQPIIPLVLHLGGRKSARYWGSQFLPKNIYNSFPGILFFALYDFSMSTMAVHNSAYVIILMVGYFVLMRFWTLSITENVESIRRLTCSTPLYQYRCLLTLGRVVNCCMGTTIFPTMVFAESILLCLLLSTLINNRTHLPILMLGNMVVALTLSLRAAQFVLAGGGHLLERSGDLKRLLQKNKDLYRRKYVRSLRDMRIYMGQFFFVTKGTFVTDLRFVLDQTITILFALR